MGMRDLNNVDGLLSCTYSEAIYKLHIFYKRARNDDVRNGIVGALFLAYERESMEAVRKDLEKI